MGGEEVLTSSRYPSDQRDLFQAGKPFPEPPPTTNSCRLKTFVKVGVRKTFTESFYYKNNQWRLKVVLIARHSWYMSFGDIQELDNWGADFILGYIYCN